jgi:hypothetical protein
MDAVMTEARLTPDAVRPERARSRQAEPIDLASVFEAHAAPMYRTILAYTGGRADIAEEAVGEAFARATAQGDSLRDPPPGSTASRSTSRTTNSGASDVIAPPRRRGRILPPRSPDCSRRSSSFLPGNGR